VTGLPRGTGHDSRLYERSEPTLFATLERTKSPITLLSDAMTIIMTMTGTDTVPFITADQKRKGL
jgi:hypothetical protein